MRLNAPNTRQGVYSQPSRLLIKSFGDDCERSKSNRPRGFDVTHICDKLFCPLAQKKSLTLEVAKQIAAAAEKEATSSKLTMVIEILDDSGNLIYVVSRATVREAHFPRPVDKRYACYSRTQPTNFREPDFRPTLLHVDAPIRLDDGATPATRHTQL